MVNTELINKIFNNTISSVIKDIDEKYIQEITIGYKDYLNRLYSNFDRKGLTEEKLEEVFTKLEKTAWESSNSKIKLSRLLKDEAFSKIKFISNTGYEYAMHMLENKNKSNDALPVITEEVCNKSISMMSELLPNVREFNVESAKMYVSEGTLDYIYASENTEFYSFRIGKM